MPNHADTLAAVGVALVANQPTVLWGPPGQGKSKGVGQISEDLDLHLETVIASLREPSDFAGLPIVDSATGSVRLAPPAWAQRLADQPIEKGGILFLDEVSTAPPAVQAALLRVVQEGWVGDMELPEEVRILAAANETDVAADGWDLAPPMANRFTHLKWELDSNMVRDGFAMGWPTFTVPNPDPETVATLLAETMILVGAFIGSKPDLVTQMPGANVTGVESAFPTPRSWESAARLYAVAKACGSDETVIRLLIQGTVGVGASNEFLNFVNNLDLPDPEELLAHPDRFTVDSGRADKIYAIAASVWAATQGNLTAERWIACGDVLAKIAEAGHSDIAFLYGRHWARNRPEGSGAMPSPAIIEHLAPILAEMQLLNR